MITVDEMVESGECPCEVCSSQDDEYKLLDKQKLDEVCDLFANEVIDLIIENHTKDILKQLDEQDKVEE